MRSFWVSVRAPLSKYGLAWVLGAPSILVAQSPPSEMGRIERAAVEAAIQRAGLGDTRPLRIVIDPMMVHPDEAPGYRQYAPRDSARHNGLLRSFKASSGRSRHVVTCTEPPCLKDIDVLVTLSEPRIDADSASISVTTQRYRRGPNGEELHRLRRRQYITTKFFLRRDAGHWRVVRTSELGIS